jgi:hypothetical protein
MRGLPTLVLTLLIVVPACTQTALGIAGADGATTADARMPSDAGVLLDAPPPPPQDAGLLIPAPQPVWPMSMSKVTSHSPAFRWVLAPGSDGATLELCRTPTCATVAYSVTVAAAASSTPSPATLTPGIWFWRLRGTLGGQSGVNTSPPWEFEVGPRSAPVSTSWGAIFDVNRDGFADVAVLDLTNTAVDVAVYSGSPSGISSTPWTTLDLATRSDANIMVNELVPAGDVNGDGFADLIVQGDNDLRILLGGATGFANPTAPIVLGAYRINAIGLGDVNGDGYGDVGSNGTIYLGGPAGPPSAASQAIYLGDPDKLDQSGWMAAPGDFNGDGYDDLVMGLSNLSGTPGAPFADVYLGGPAGPTFGGRLGDVTGARNCAAAVPYAGGDLNGDGYEDVTLGCDAAFPGVYEFNGGPTLPTQPAECCNYAGEITVMDVNGDGADDQLGWADQLGGSSYELALGTPGGAGLTQIPTNSVYVDNVAIEFAGAAGDINGDGYDDAVFATTLYVTPPRAYVGFGAAQNPLQQIVRIDAPAGTTFAGGVAMGKGPGGGVPAGPAGATRR